MNMTIAQIMEKMIRFSEGNIHDIDHFIRVWTPVPGPAIILIVGLADVMSTVPTLSRRSVQPGSMCLMSAMLAQQLTNVLS